MLKWRFWPLSVLQTDRMRLLVRKNMASLARAVQRLLACCLGLGCVLAGYAQTILVPQGQEYQVIAPAVGDQLQAWLDLGPGGGYLVWQDNYTDGFGSAIVARRLDGTLSGQYSAFQVNQTAAGDQEKPRVCLLKDGGAVMVWQGSQTGDWNIYARFLGSNGVFITGDILVNTFTNSDQTAPALAVLADGSVVVAWTSIGQDGDKQGVFLQRLSATGQKLGAETMVNRFTTGNQRSPALAALTNGQFVVTWISEDQRFDGSADVYARVFGVSGTEYTTVMDEFLLSAGNLPCESPAAVGSANGGYVVSWAQEAPVDTNRSAALPENGWDVVAATVNFVGSKPVKTITRVNGETFGHQYAPRLAALGQGTLVVWTSLGQDGMDEGIYGRYLDSGGRVNGDEFRVNTTWRSRQYQPAVAFDKINRALVVWSCFKGGDESFDLLGQRYQEQLAPLAAPSAPFVMALSPRSLNVTWPALSGLQVSGYGVYVDGAATPILTTNNFLTVSNLTPGSTHTVSIDYRLADGRVSPQSAAATGVTWGYDDNFDGLPDDWQQMYWGPNAAQWGGRDADSDGDGMTNLQEFLAGTNPRDASSCLKLQMKVTAQGRRLEWMAVPGAIYQVQYSTNLGQWYNLDVPRFAAGTVESAPVGSSWPVTMFRIIRVR